MIDANSERTGTLMLLQVLTGGVDAGPDNISRWECCHENANKRNQGKENLPEAWPLPNHRIPSGNTLQKAQRPWQTLVPTAPRPLPAVGSLINFCLSIFASGAWLKGFHFLFSKSLQAAPQDPA